MIDKLQRLEVPVALVHWVLNFLSNHPQGVRMDDTVTSACYQHRCVSGLCSQSILYTLYSNDFRSVDPSTMFVRFSNDTAMLALLSDFASYQSSFLSRTFLHLVQYQLSASQCFHFSLYIIELS